MDIKNGQCANKLIVFVSGILLLLSFSVWGVNLKDLKVAEKPGDWVELMLVFDGPAPDAKGYSIEKPARISIDLLDTTSALPRYNELNFDVAKSVTALQVGNRTRLIITQEESSIFSYRADGNNLYVSIGNGAKSAAKTSDVEEDQELNDSYVSSSYSGAPSSEKMSDMNISLIDFQRGEEGDGKVIITFPGSSIPFDVSEVAGRIRLQFKGDVLPEKLKNRLDVIDFATPVKYIEAKIEDGNSVIIIEPKGKYDYLAYQVGNNINVSVKAIEEVVNGGPNQQPTYTGKKLSFNFQNITIRAVLQLIADEVDLNLVVSNSVTGSLTLRLDSIPWDHALDIILKANGLGKRLNDNVLTVAPAEEIAAREKQQLENAKQLRNLAPLYTNLVQVNYASAEEIQAVLGGVGDAKILTDRGSVQVLERTNSLLIKDTQEKLDEIKALLELIDIPIRQVQIEARIVTLSSKFSKELGVKWDSKGAINSGNDSSSDVSGSVFTDFNQSSKGLAKIGLGFVVNGTLLNLELSALLSDGGGEIISQPKIITADKKTAIISSGSQVSFSETSPVGGRTTSFKDAVLSLEVTPQITPDGRVIMDVKITNDEVQATEVGAVPSISKNEIETQVLVRDGETLVLGGVFKQTENHSKLKVPILGDIPYLGALFKTSEMSNDKDELMVFITPRIIDDSDNNLH
ncbi:MAG: type IV pilus secretin PilQ [Candidatus Endonucleobacter sp. (ex Gigantidas childressi)]|nr:type IV pilus secretin PilQ [Candidatus Endonucleobacter sp. (ex Gigantidas childressi)]